MRAEKALVGMGAPGTRLLLIALCLLTSTVSDAATELPPVLLQSLLDQYEHNKDTLGNTHYVALVNYRQPSWEPRFYVIDPHRKQIVAAYRVAHGKGSDPDHDGIAERFGDGQGSHRSSVGLFRTGNTYVSTQDSHGLSLRLQGLSGTNQNAYDRGIVIHANDYMEEAFISTNGMPGRSHGCLVFSAADRNEVIDRLGDGALIYAVH